MHNAKSTFFHASFTQLCQNYNTRNNRQSRLSQNYNIRNNRANRGYLKTYILGTIAPIEVISKLYYIRNRVNVLVTRY